MVKILTIWQKKSADFRTRFIEPPENGVHLTEFRL
jgi:hypothetical protein